jgi:hypothetical protein
LESEREKGEDYEREKIMKRNKARHVDDSYIQLSFSSLVQCRKKSLFQGKLSLPDSLVWKDYLIWTNLLAGL